MANCTAREQLLVSSSQLRLVLMSSPGLTGFPIFQKKSRFFLCEIGRNKFKRFYLPFSLQKW